jgi:hypothetical protein
MLPMRRACTWLALALLLPVVTGSCHKETKWFQDPKHDSVQPNNCSAPSCKPNEEPLFNTEVPNKHHCTCAPGYYRPAEGQDCVQCPDDKVCPDRSDHAFSCPPDTQPAKHLPEGTHLVHDGPFTYCVSNPGYNCSLKSNMLRDYPHRVFLRDTSRSYLYTAKCREPCGKYKDANTNCASCLPGYYRDERSDCAVCPPGFYCDENQKTPCPPGNTSVIGAASPTDCHLVSCPPGKYKDTAAQRCVTCPVDHYCRHNEQKKCPLHAKTTSIGSPSAAYCACQRPYYVQPLPNTKHGFACAFRATHAPALDPIFP